MHDAPQGCLNVRIFRHLDYCWTLAGISLADLLLACVPGFVYAGLSQWAATFAGSVPAPAYLLLPTLVVGFATVLLQLSFWQLHAHARRLAAAALVAAIDGGLLLVDHGLVALPMWPGFALIAAGLAWAVCAQMNAPPGALGRQLGALLLPIQCSALRRGRRRPAPFAQESLPC